jgi:SAM-dependent methyltransferase
MTGGFDWTGRVGDVWAAEWRRTDRSFSDLSPRLDAAILAAAPERGRALDIGCGAGGTAMALAAWRPNLAITGIDLSPALVAIARERAAGIANLDFRVADAQSTGGETADLLFSRHGVMFFDDPAAGFAALRDAAVPGGRLVFSSFASREQNEWAVALDSAVGNPVPVPVGYAPGPFGLADADFTGGLLARSGWIDVVPELAEFSYVAG